MFAFNPVFFYWSLRIYADVFFALLALISLYLLKLTTSKSKWFFAFLLGLVCGLTIATRFEGYILTTSVFAGLVLCNVTDIKGSLRRLYKAKSVLVSFLIALVLIEIPYFIFRNPLSSKYFDETARRTVSVESTIIFAASLFFVFGFINAFAFLVANVKEVPKISKTNIALILFISLELLLAFLWPAAIPRLFVPIIPYLIIFTATSITKYFDVPAKPNALRVVELSAFFAAFYVLVQYLFRQQFLINIRFLFITVLAIYALTIYFTYTYKFKPFVISLIATMLIWTSSSIWVHKDIYTSLKEAATYVSQNLSGKVAYNDVSSICDWYINNHNAKTSLVGEYYNVSNKNDIELSKLQKNHFEYVILTNEHNTSLDLDLEHKSYLISIAKYQHIIYGRKFWTEILKVDTSK
jgi:hypothetical protein